MSHAVVSVSLHASQKCRLLSAVLANWPWLRKWQQNNVSGSGWAVFGWGEQKLAEQNKSAYWHPTVACRMPVCAFLDSESTFLEMLVCMSSAIAEIARVVLVTHAPFSRYHKLLVKFFLRKAVKWLCGWDYRLQNPKLPKMCWAGRLTFSCFTNRLLINKR